MQKLSVNDLAKRLVPHIKKAYYFFEDNYYALMDKVNEKLPIYKIIDPIDNFVPSLVLFVLLFVAVFAGVFVFVSLPKSIVTNFSVLDENGEALAGLQATVVVDENSFLFVTDNNGLFSVEFREKKAASVSIEADAFEDFSQPVELDGTKQVLTLKKKPKKIVFTGPFNISVVDEDGNPIKQDVSARFSCSDNPAAAPAAQTNDTGFFSVTIKEDCGEFLASFLSDGFDQVSSFSISKPEITAQLKRSVEETRGILNVVVKDVSDKPVPSATVALFDSAGISLFEGQTDETGKAAFGEIEPSDYNLVVSTDDGRQGSKTIRIDAGKTSTVSIVLKTAVETGKGKKVLLKIVDSNSLQGISGVNIVVFSNKTVFKKDVSNSDGLITVRIAPEEADKNFSAVLTHPSFVLKIVPGLLVVSDSVTDAQQIQMSAVAGDNSNYGNLKVFVVNEEGTAVANVLVNAFVSIFSTDYDNPLYPDPKTADDNGMVLFTNLQPGTYKAYARKPDFDEDYSQIIKVDLNKTTTVIVNLVIGRGQIKAIVKDSQSNPIGNAKVAFVDTVTGKIVDSNSTDASGLLTSIPLKVSRRFSVVASADGFYPSASAPIMVVKNTLKDANILLYRLNEVSSDKNVSFKFLGLFKEDGSQGIVQAGQSYIAKFVLFFSQDKKYSDVTMHLRAGLDSQKTSSVSNAFVQNVFTAFSPILVFSRTLSSDIYSSADPVPNDSNAKLMNVFWRDINRGFVELNAKITVKQGLPDGAPIELHYSAKAKVADEDYFTQDFSKLFRVGQSACIENCDSSIGWVFEIQHDSERHAIMPGATEKLEKGYDYNLFYSIYNLTDSAFSSASLTVKNTDTSLLSFFGHETENSFSVFSAVNIPANSVYSYGMTSPLSFNAKSETSFLDVNFVLSTTPKIKDGDDSNVSGLTFSIKSTNFLTLELPKSLPQNPSGITVIVKDQKTGALLDNAFVQVLPDALFPGTGARRALKVFGQAGTYYVQFESGFMPERFVSVKATVIGHKDAEKLVYVSGEAPDIISNYDYSCIKIDANTLKAEDQNAAFLLRGQSTNLVFRSANCPYASTVSLSVPSYLSDFVTINYSNGKNISLQRNDAAGIPVTIQVSQKAPIGKIPIFVDAKFSADVFLRRIKGVHLIVTDKTSCFAMLDRENFFGNQTITETLKTDFDQGTIQKIDSVSEDGNLLLSFEKGSKIANLGASAGNYWFAVPGNDKIYVFKQNSSSPLKTFNCLGIKPESNIVGANGYFGVVGNDVACSGYYDDSVTSPTKLIRNQTFGVKYSSSIAVLVDAANNINFVTVANTTIYQWRANSSAFKIINSVQGITEASIVAATINYFTVVGTDYSYSWNSNLIDNAAANPLRKYNTTGTKPGSKIAGRGVFFATVSGNENGKIFSWDASADALTKIDATNVSAESNIVVSSNDYFLAVGDNSIYSWQKNLSSTIKSYFASGTSIASKIVATDIFAVAAKDKAYGIVPANSLFRDYQTPGTFPTSGISLGDENFFSITGTNLVFSAKVSATENDSINGLKKFVVPDLSSNSNIATGKGFFVAPGTNTVAIWQKNLQPRSLATTGTSVFSSVAFNNATAFAITAKDKVYIVEKDSFSNASVLPKQLLLAGMEIQAAMQQVNGYFMAVSTGKSFSFKSDLTSTYFTTADAVVSGYSVSGKYVSKNYSIAEPGNKSTVSSIRWKSTGTDNTTISAKYSLDNGANWNSVSNGQFVLKQSEKIMLSFDFATTNRLETPRIEEIKITYAAGTSSSTDKFEYDVSNATDKGIIFNNCYSFVEDLQKPTMNIIAGIEPNAVSLRYSPAPKSPPVKLKEIYSFPSSCVEKENGVVVECIASPTTAEDTFVSQVIIADCPPNSTYHNYQTENFGTSARLLDARQRIILTKTVTIPGTSPPQTQVVDCMNYDFGNAILFKFNNVLDSMPKNQKSVKLMLYSGKDSSLLHSIYLPRGGWGSATTWATPKPDAGDKLVDLKYNGNGWWQADITQTYNAWKEIPATNQGVYIISTDSLSDLTNANFPNKAMDEFSFYSSENANIEHRPKLVFGTAPEADVDHKGITDFNVSNRILVGEDNYALIETVDHALKNGSVAVSSEKFHVQLKAPVLQECVLPNNIFGKTGDFALPRIRFDWSWGANGLNEQYNYGECDQNNQDSIYCDATQFSLMLLRKINKIHDLALEAKYEQIAPYLHFNSYLIRDGYGIDFRKDFDYFMQNKNFNDTASFYLGDTGLWKYFSNENLMTIDSQNFDAQKVLDKPGLYRVDLSFDWQSESNKWVFFNAKNPIAKINITLTRISEPTISSPFYELPFDGKIGYSKRTDETTASRQYYGLGYTGQSIYLINNPGGSIVETNTIASSLAAYAVSKGSSFNELNADAMRGTLLSIDLIKRQIKFSPNSATPILMQIDSTDTNVPGYYSIFKETNPRTNEVEPFIFEKYGTVWSSIASSMNCQDFSNNGIFNNVPDKPAYAFNEECLNFEQSQGFKWFNIPTENINKKLFLRTIFYSPAGEKYFLRRGCYNNTAFVSPNYIIAPGPTESQITLDYTKEKFPIDSINALLEKVSGVGGQKVCISQDQNKINFWWNPQAINRELENKTTYGNTYDIGNLVTNDSWLCATTQ